MPRLSVRFEVIGTPTAKARPRFAKSGRTYKTKQQADAEREFRLWAVQALKKARYKLKAVPKDLPLFVRLLYVMPRPKRVKQNGFHVLRPDTDNLVKFSLDALNGYAWLDDSQVSMILAAKLYWTGEPRVIMYIDSLEDFPVDALFGPLTFGDGGEVMTCNVG